MQLARDEVNRARADVGGSPATTDVLSLATLKDARDALPEQPVLFVLGNSHHHLQTLEYLLTHGAYQTDALHLHDVFIRGLLALHFKTESALRKALLDAYPVRIVDLWRHSGEGAFAGAGPPLGPRILVRRTGIRHIIVNSAAAADRLSDDLGVDAAGVRIDVTFLPIFARPTSHQPCASSVLRVGHFGTLHAGKQIDRLVAACDRLAALQPINLVLAGYRIGPYLRRNHLERDYVQVKESPSDQELEELMLGVDCGVQLRYPDHGESSGVVNQLLALRRPVVCTRTGSFAEMGGAVSLVAPNITPADLAEVIRNAAAGGWPASAEELVRQRSSAIFEARMRELLRLGDAAVGWTSTP